MLNVQNFSMKQINPKELGYCRQDGCINFQNEESVEKYAKNKILNGLKQNREVEVLTKDSTFLKSFDGDEHSVSVKLKDFPNIKGVTVWHGHPNSCGVFSYPFSPDDTKMLLLLNKLLGYNKSVVYNSLGEKCTMSIDSTESNKILNLLPVFLKHVFVNPKVEQLSDIVDKIESKYLNQDRLDEYLHSFLDRCNEKELKFYENLKSQNDNPEAQKELAIWIISKINCLMAHDAIKEYSKELGINYQTDFSHLVDKT